MTRSKKSQSQIEAKDTSLQTVQRQAQLSGSWLPARESGSDKYKEGSHGSRSGLLFANIPKRVMLLVAIVVISISASVVAVATGTVDAQSVEALADSSGYWTMVGYVVGVVAMQLLWLPRLWGLLAAGVIFGPVTGGTLALVADTISAAICYLLARSTARDWIASILRRKPKANHLVRIFAQQKGAITIALLRASPVAHYTLVSYSAGISGMSSRAFFIGNTLGLLPGSILYPLVGNSITKPTSPVFLISTGILVIFLIITVVVAKRALPQ